MGQLYILVSLQYILDGGSEIVGTVCECSQFLSKIPNCLFKIPILTLLRQGGIKNPPGYIYYCFTEPKLKMSLSNKVFFLQFLTLCRRRRVWDRWCHGRMHSGVHFWRKIPDCQCHGHTCPFYNISNDSGVLCHLPSGEDRGTCKKEKKNINKSQNIHKKRSEFNNKKSQNVNQIEY